MTRNLGKGNAEATVQAGARRKDGAQVYVIHRKDGREKTVVTTGESVRQIRNIMSDHSDLMRRLADR